jgi:hypothetical protein
MMTDEEFAAYCRRLRVQFDLIVDRTTPGECMMLMAEWEAAGMPPEGITPYDVVCYNEVQMRDEEG